MAYKIFVDTNVYIDFLLQRGNSWQDAETVFTLAENRDIVCYTSASCILNLMYIMRSYKLPVQKVNEYCSDLLKYSTLVNPDNLTFSMAISSPFSDKEDAVQYYTALHVKDIDFFITANIKDYRHALPQLPVVTSSQFLKKYNE